MAESPKWESYYRGWNVEQEISQDSVYQPGLINPKKERVTEKSPATVNTEAKPVSILSGIYQAVRLRSL